MGKLFTSLLFLTLFFLSCDRSSRCPQDEWLEVVKFEQTAVSDTYIYISERNTYRGKAYLYNMVLLDSKKHVLERKLISNKVYRFFPGDTIKISSGNILMKE